MQRLVRAVLYEKGRFQHPMDAAGNKISFVYR